MITSIAIFLERMHVTLRRQEFKKTFSNTAIYSKQAVSSFDTIVDTLLSKKGLESSL